MSTTPPERQCTMPGCDREVADGRTRGGLCEEHVPDDAAGTGETANTGESDPEGTETPDTNPGVDAGETTGDMAVDEEAARAAFRDAILYFHGQLDRKIPDHTDTGEHPDRPTTARKYFTDGRGWDDDTLEANRLGYAPASDGLRDALMRKGHDKAAMHATGLFTEDLRPLWQGRYVLPYFDETGAPVYAIARTTGDVGGGAAGYDGHPEDFLAGKYAKVKHTDDRVPFSEPIWGLQTLEDGEPVLVAEGIADAITARERGFSVLSPVAKEFKEDHYPPLLDAVEAHDIPRVYVVADNDPWEPDEMDAYEDPEQIRDAVTLPAAPAGVGGALRTAEHLQENDVDVHVAVPPAPRGGENDLDEFLQEWGDTPAPLLRSARPPEDYPEYELATRSAASGGSSFDPSDGYDGDSDGPSSALWDLDLGDLLSVNAGDRGHNPLGPTGSRDDYFVVREGRDRDLVARDYKRDVVYNAVTYLLVDAGERRVSAPEGSLDEGEIFAAWRHAKEEGYLPDDDPVPHAGLRYVAVEKADLCDREELRDGWQIPAPAYDAALEHIREEVGLDPGREDVRGGPSDAEEVDPTTLEITLDPATAWEAAATVTPEDVPALDLEPAPSGAGWIDPFTGEAIGDVARAVGVAEGELHRADAGLEGDTYHRLYHRARDAYDAPIPEYVDTAEATARWDVVRAAIGQLDFYDLDRTALKSDVTGEGNDVDGEAVLTLDPAWRPSESGESVLVFDSGAVYDADTDTTVDPLRLVALEAGLMDTPTARLEGEEFRAAYRTAREEYGAPLPTWKVGTPDVTAVLPRAEELVGDATPADRKELEAAWGDVEELYRDLATGRGDAHLLNVLPGLGKTTACLKTAADVPTTYLAGRKELMAAAADRADEFGASHRYLPVFSGDKPDTDVLDEAVAAVRQNGKSLLREPWRLREGVSGEVFPENGDEDDEDEIDLGRPTCETAEGEHGDEWALAVHVARELDYTPRDIHELAHGLFGDTLPCQDGGDCPYSAGWDAVSDPDDPADLLIGHPVHAHVQSARTYYTRDGRGKRKETGRAVVVDEFPGTVYARDFGPEFMDHATWLARALRSDVEDRQDLFEADLWGDEWVRAWLRGEGDEYEPVAELLAYVKDRRRKIHAVNTAEAVLEDYRDLAADWNLEDPLAELVAAYPDLGDVREDVVRDVRAAVEAVPPEAAGFRVINWVREHVLSPLESVEGATADVDDTPISGELRRFLTDALEDAREGKNGAEDALDNAESALLGGDRGARALSVYADDADAHRLANKLLEGVITPDEEDDPATRIATASFAYGDDRDGTTLKHAEAADGTTILVDRDHDGASVLDTPDRTAADGNDVPLIGLDATGRERLWSLAIGADVERADIHDTHAERARFLREHMDLQVVKAADRIRSYEGNPKGKDLDGDVALIERIREEYSGVHGASDGDPVTVGDPAVITTKCVRDVLEDDDRLRDVVSEWDNYGNVAGSNSLGEHKLAAVLGSQHYGDHAVEYMAALAGEEVSRSGRGHTLDYGSPVANAYLKHMREDQTMQAVLRFTRGGSGAIVFARTAALRPDLPVVGEGHVVNSWNATATTLARELRRRRGDEFTVADVAGAVDVTKTQVRRILDEFAQLGYVDKHETPNGLANEFAATGTPGAGEVDLPSDLDGVTADDPNDGPIDRYYTANVRVVPPDSGEIGATRGAIPVLPAPDATVEADPPG
jgi:hypothetical protein